ncbi:YciI family protein [Massilia sp. erpn]|uniref:YciI family protein n=1 Tax=Massilia sp. erpn TaxID=2738142 RepID=UPI00210736CE|nr:YciI family protein [Massilia sp. erpn]UTY58760.1 hypothetical protein HPQ68_17110 [Massilia sp. erpn]
MHFMILRRADASTEQASFPPPGLTAALPDGKWLHSSERSTRMKYNGSAWEVEQGPFPNAHEMVAGFTVIEANDQAEAIEWAKQWPTADNEGEFTLEVRETGCTSGCLGFEANVPPQLTPYMVLLKANEKHERDEHVDPAHIALMMRRNEEGVRAGVILAGEGLKPAAQGARVKLSGGRHTVIDGPFTEIKELIAGYWVIQTASREEAYEWVRNYPFPNGPDIQIELREVVRQ